MRTNLVDMSLDLFAIDFTLGDTFLIDSHGSEIIVYLGVAFFTPIGDNADDDLLPRALTPRLRAISGAEVTDILHDPVHSLCKKINPFLYSNVR